MNQKTYIEKAIEGGWNYGRTGHDRITIANGEAYFGLHGTVFYLKNVSEILLDPRSWQAVGKVEGWERKHQGYWEPKIEMHRMIDALAEGKTIEEFLETL